MVRLTMAALMNWGRAPMVVRILMDSCFIFVVWRAWGHFHQNNNTLLFWVRLEI
jgi:hypothetical protein